MRKPTTNPVTQTAAQHGYSATDYSFQPDEWVYFPENGVVTDVTLNAGDCGKRVIFKGDETGAEYYMCHFRDVGVLAGKRYGEGARVGIMGETGKAYGRHLHLVISVGGKRVPDPDAWMNSKLKPVGGNKDMTRKFIIMTYEKIAGRTPSEKEIAFHLAKSTPESFVGGFKDADTMWKKLKAKVDAARKALA